MSLPQSGTVAFSLRTTPETPKMRRVSSYVDPSVSDKLTEIAADEQMEVSGVIREFIAIGLRFYKYKKGILNPENPETSKTFYCQECGQVTKLRYMHNTIVLNETVSFCEPCFFNERYKNTLHKLVRSA